MYPTGWGWLAVVSGLGSIAVFACWRRRHRGNAWAATIFILTLLLFLFSSMQWASWYK